MLPTSELDEVHAHFTPLTEIEGPEEARSDIRKIDEARKEEGFSKRERIQFLSKLASKLELYRNTVMLTQHASKTQNDIVTSAIEEARAQAAKVRDADAHQSDDPK